MVSNMKRTKNLIIMMAVLIVLCGGIVAVKSVEKHIDKISTIDEEILAITNEEISELSWKYDGSELKFVKTDDVWKSADDSTFPVSQEKIAQFLEHFASVHASFIINDVEDYDQYGLGTPECTIQIKKADTDVTISLGGFSTMDSKRYISIGDGNVYLIDDDLLEYVKTDRDDFFQNDVFPDFTQVTGMKLSGKKELEIVHEEDADYTYTSFYPYYLVEGTEHKAISTSYARTFINQILEMDTTDYETYQVDENELSKYGLDEPNLTVVITGDVEKDEDTLVSESVQLGIGYVDDEHIYARMEDSNNVFKVSKETYDALLEGDYASLRAKEVLKLDWSLITKISTVFEDETYEILADLSDKDETKYTLNGEEIDITDIKSDINALSLEEVSELGQKGKLECTFTISMDNEAYPELTVSLYRYDGDQCVVTLQDEVIGFTKRVSMSDLREHFTSLILNLNK